MRFKRFSRGNQRVRERERICVWEWQNIFSHCYRRWKRLIWSRGDRAVKEKKSNIMWQYILARYQNISSINLLPPALSSMRKMNCRDEFDLNLSPNLPTPSFNFPSESLCVERERREYNYTTRECSRSHTRLK
jgi:hypothetical protein